MSKLIQYEIITPTKALVTSMHYNPEKLSEQEKQGWVAVENILELAVPQEGKTGILYINPQTLEQWYEYVDRPLTPQEEIQKLKNQVSDLELQIAQLISQGGTA